MGIAGAQLIKARKPVTGKKGEPGRFVTLKTGRVIFLPEGRRTKWADVKEKVVASKRVPWGEGRVVEQTRLTSGTNPNYLVEFEDGSKAIHKISQNTGTAEAELLAYGFSESIGWGIVPETIMPEGTKDVTRQRWVEGQTAWDLEEEAPSKDHRMLMMDVILQNADRHRMNILIDSDDKQWAVDNGAAFGAGWDQSGEKSYRYGDTAFWTSSSDVHPDHTGLIDAAKDVDRWSKTPEYTSYVRRVEETLGPAVASQFSSNVADIAEWSGRARVVERALTLEEEESLLEWTVS